MKFCKMFQWFDSTKQDDILNVVLLAADGRMRNNKRHNVGKTAKMFIKQDC